MPVAVWIDSHCHLPYEGLDDPAAEIEDAHRAGVTRLITVGTDLDQSQAAVAVAKANDGVWATIGLHPHDAKSGFEPVADLVARHAGDREVVAVGECGLDFHYDHSPRDVQRWVFSAQIALARQHDLALVIHSREAWDDTFAILDAEGVPERTIFHCFTGGAEEARRALDRGCYLSFSGIVTFKAADDVRAAAALCPLDRVLVETDSPYLAPVPHRGAVNHPAYVVHVGEAVARVKEVDVTEFASAVWANAEHVFRI